MTITTAIILGLILSIIIIFITLNFDQFKKKKVLKHQDSIDKIQARIAKANGASIEQFSLNQTANNQKIKNDILYQNADFINKNCSSLDDFIINDTINEFDLRKLAELNEIKLQISEGWYPLTLQLIRELNENGWNKKVGCIKEKWARLEFYTQFEPNSQIHNIITKYNRKSENVCETCGERGEIRYNTIWQYVACRKHYLENRGNIILTDKGFIHNGNTHLWNEIDDIYFQDLDFNNNYNFLILQFNSDKIQHQGWTDNKLYISKNTIGFGNFLQNIPRNMPSLDLDYLTHFDHPEFCEICGYKAVFYNKCECCENETWKIYQERFNENDDEKDSHIAYNQIQWKLDEGEIFESKLKNYPKNPHYKILFTDSDLKEYLDDED